jgi:hypothetical protein
MDCSLKYVYIISFKTVKKSYYQRKLKEKSHFLLVIYLS